MRTLALMVSLLLSMVLSLSCKAVDFVGPSQIRKPIKNNIAENNEENCIDVASIICKTLITNNAFEDAVIQYLQQHKDDIPEVPIEAIEPQEEPEEQQEEQKEIVNEDEIPVTSADVPETTLPDPDADTYVDICDSKDTNIVLYKLDLCGYCLKMDREIRENAKCEYRADYPFAGGLTDTGQRIKKYPTTEIFYKGTRILTVSGYMSWNDLKKQINSRVQKK